MKGSPVRVRASALPTKRVRVRHDKATERIEQLKHRIFRLLAEQVDGARNGSDRARAADRAVDRPATLDEVVDEGLGH